MWTRNPDLTVPKKAELNTWLCYRVFSYWFGWKNAAVELSQVPVERETHISTGTDTDTTPTISVGSLLFYLGFYHAHSSPSSAPRPAGFFSQLFKFLLRDSDQRHDVSSCFGCAVAVTFMSLLIPHFRMKKSRD